MNSKEILLAIKAGKIRPQDVKNDLFQILKSEVSKQSGSPSNVISKEDVHYTNSQIDSVKGTQVNEKYINEHNKTDSKALSDAIAIIGIDGQFPKAKNPEEYWNNIINGVDCITEIPSERWSIDDFYDADPNAVNKTYCKWGGLIEDYDKFDPQFFNIAPSEAELMDPQQRLFLESCWHCMEDAGLSAKAISGSNCGVFVGCASSDYNQNIGDKGLNAQGLTGSSASILAGRISYLLNLTGICLSIDTACSSSLVAIAEACNNLILENCDLAFAGGVSSLAGPSMFIMCSKAGMLSPDGKCYPFDSRANGFVPGEGVGVVLLKRLSDAVRDNDHIYGIVRGWGVNQDGKTNGITAPSAKSQAKLEQGIYDRFNINPETITLIEAQGTGSKMGDPIEIEALTEVFKSHTDKNSYCALGSVKSNIGHLFGASGVASFIKLVLAIHNKTLPPTINFGSLNEHISLQGSPFYINTRPQAWQSSSCSPRRGAVSAFGFSGTNAHIVVEEYIPNNNTAKALIADYHRPILFVLSAKTEDRLRAYAEAMKKFINDNLKINLIDMSYTLMIGRDEFDYRLSFTAQDHNEVLDKLDRFINNNCSEEAIYYEHIDKKNNRSKPSLDTKALLLDLDYDNRLSKAGELWAKGYKIAWDILFSECSPRRISIPEYPFQRNRYWLAHIAANKTDEILSEYDNVEITLNESIMLQQLHKLVSQVLGIPKEDIDVGVELAKYGLHSINGMMLIAAVKKQFEVQLSSRELYDNNSVSELSQYLYFNKALEGKTVTISTPRDISSKYSCKPMPSCFPLSLSQRSLWVLHQWMPENYAYNLPIAFKISSEINAEALKTAFSKLLLRHPILGSKMLLKEQEPVCIIQQRNNFSFSCESLVDMKEQQLIDYLIKLGRQPFDLEHGPLMKVILFSKTESEHILFINIHHIVFDGSSMPILVNELTHFYEEEINGIPKPLVPLNSTYADYVEWQRNLLESSDGCMLKEYWLNNRLKGDLPVLNLPIKAPRSEKSSFKGTTYSKDISLELTAKIDKLSLEKKVSHFVLMLCAFKALLNKFTEQEDIIVGTVLQGRPGTEYSNLIGLFTNAVIIRSNLSKELLFSELLKQVQSNVFEALEYGIYPYSEISRIKDNSFDRNNAPLVQVMFLFQNWMKDASQLNTVAEAADRLMLKHIPEVHQEGEFEITLEIMMSNSQYRLLFKYNDVLYEQEFIQSLCENYIKVLEWLAFSCEGRLKDILYSEDIAKWQKQAVIETRLQPSKPKNNVKSVFKVKV